MSMRELGRTGIGISAIGLGGAQFSGGARLTSYPALPQSQVDAIVKAALDGGITWFDTAEAYGRGASERALGTALAHAGTKPGEVTVATKWTPLGRTAGTIERTIADRIANLAPFPVDLYQIHAGFGSFSSVRAQVRAMGRLAEAGKIRAVGVANFSARQMQIAHTELARQGIPLASNQVQINLLHRKIETNGVLEAARRLGITLIAYMPLRSGLLTGKFHANRDLVARLPRLRRMTSGISGKNLDRTAALIGEMRAIADEHQATIPQIALAWLTSYYGDTVVAIPGASKVHHAEEAVGALKVALSQAELRRLADLSTSVTS